MIAIVDLLRQEPAVFAGVVFLFSLLIGSFLNVVIHRLPIMMNRDWEDQCAALAGNEPPTREKYSLVVPRSACPKCGQQISALQNIPVVSYLFLKGNCAGCGVHIPVRYPVVELMTAVFAVVVAWRFGAGAEALAGIALTYALVALSGIDIDTQYLPDSITLPLLWLGLILSLFHAEVGADVLFLSPSQAIIGAAAGYLTLWSVYHLFRLATGKEGMGYGDFKLLAVLGAWLGWQKLPLIILLSAFVGAAVGIALMVFKRHGREVPLPFGPYLAAAGWVAMIWGDPIIDTYLNVSGLR